MTRIWKEPYDARRHRDSPFGFPDRTANLRRAPTLHKRHVFFVRVCSFTFEFHSIDQIKAYRDYYARKIVGSTRIAWEGDHTESQRWHEKLPLYLRENSKRLKVVAALDMALAKYDKESVSAHPAQQQVPADVAVPSV